MDVQSVHNRTKCYSGHSETEDVTMGECLVGVKMSPGNFVDGRYSGHSYFPLFNSQP